MFLKLFGIVNQVVKKGNFLKKEMSSYSVTDAPEESIDASFIF